MLALHSGPRVNRNPHQNKRKHSDNALVETGVGNLFHLLGKSVHMAKIDWTPPVTKPVPVPSESLGPLMTSHGFDTLVSRLTNTSHVELVSSEIIDLRVSGCPQVIYKSAHEHSLSFVYQRDSRATIHCIIAKSDASTSSSDMKHYFKVTLQNQTNILQTYSLPLHIKTKPIDLLEVKDKTTNEPCDCGMDLEFQTLDQQRKSYLWSQGWHRSTVVLYLLLYKSAPDSGPDALHTIGSDMFASRMVNGGPIRQLFVLARDRNMGGAFKRRAKPSACHQRALVLVDKKKKERLPPGSKAMFKCIELNPCWSDSVYASMAQQVVMDGSRTMTLVTWDRLPLRREVEYKNDGSLHAELENRPTRIEFLVANLSRMVNDVVYLEDGTPQPINAIWMGSLQCDCEPCECVSGERPLPREGHQCEVFQNLRRVATQYQWNLFHLTVTESKGNKVYQHISTASLHCFVTMVYFVLTK